jgi:hypothetical protein
MSTKTAKTPVEDQQISEGLFYVTRDYGNFTSAGNAIMKKIRVESITPHILKTWIKRFIMTYEGDSELFGVSLEKNNVVAWFKYEIDAKYCEMLFDEIISNGYPKPKSIY